MRVTWNKLLALGNLIAEDGPFYLWHHFRLLPAPIPLLTERFLLASFLIENLRFMCREFCLWPIRSYFLSFNLAVKYSTVLYSAQRIDLIKFRSSHFTSAVLEHLLQCPSLRALTSVIVARLPVIVKNITIKSSRKKNQLLES